MVLKAVQAPTVQEAVYDQIYQAIVSGKIQPGERLTMRQLANDLEVSVMPVREALRRLEARNFITIHRSKQITVNVLSTDYFLQILEARLLLEGYAARKASKMRSEDSLIELEKTLKEMKNTKDEVALMEANERFHRVIYSQANLPVIMDIIDSLWERVNPYFHILKKDQAFWVKRVYLKNHIGMLDGMRNKDPRNVYKWLKQDLEQASEVLMPMLEQ
jgi:DNA-binding GntR family transcriptional regulator